MSAANLPIKLAKREIEIAVDALHKERRYWKGELQTEKDPRIREWLKSNADACSRVIFFLEQSP